ncbi:MAG: DUF4369 domain-containing protein [Muribaculaceae bacterium]|nr:DUF4369 domain-containing protein [Muribaculaceae bacterium]
MKLLKLMAFALVMMCAACTRNEFNMDLDLSGVGTADFQVVYYASDSRQGFYVETNMVAREGKGTLRGITRYPTLVYITSRHIHEPLVVYAERGDKISLKGDSPDQLGWEVSGNKVNDEWSAWRMANAAALRSGKPDSINAAVARFVREQPESKVSLLLMLTTFIRRSDPLLYRELWKDLDNDLRHSALVQLAGRPDQRGATLSQVARVESMVLRGRGRLDTVITSRVPATLLCFWMNTSYKRSGTLMDSIRALATEFPDSASRSIVDICMNSDSAAWISALPKDSLKGVTRSWMPLGTTDPAALTIGVGYLPCLVVVDKGGDIVYQGDSISLAMKTFRQLME